MAKRSSKTAAQQCRYYEVDNIFVYMVETYIITVQSTQEIMATVSSPRSVANAYRGALSIEPTSKSTIIS